MSICFNWHEILGGDFDSRAGDFDFIKLHIHDSHQRHDVIESYGI